MSTGSIEQFKLNTKGRDFAVGDIHGSFSRLRAALEGVCFDVARDRLFCVGDLVDRGPESEQAIEWLAFSWFHSVRGNHDQFVIECMKGNCAIDMHVTSGGGWFYKLPAEQRQAFFERFQQLPLAIEVETARGIVGIVHADVPPDWTWSMLRHQLGSRMPGIRNDHERELDSFLQWSRGRLDSEDDSGVRGVRAVIAGHTRLREGPVFLGNVIFIDTGGWHGVPGGTSRFTLLNLSTLRAENPVFTSEEEVNA
jgi:serine/threonine protein phosphatase 1